jgi:hypothetical protein
VVKIAVLLGAEGRAQRLTRTRSEYTVLRGKEAAKQLMAKLHSTLRTDEQVVRHNLVDPLRRELEPGMRPQSQCYVEHPEGSPEFGIHHRRNCAESRSDDLASGKLPDVGIKEVYLCSGVTKLGMAARCD